jgi:hypothetical protein
MDEVELIGPCLDHLNRIGVFDIIVHDMGSTDGTRDILRSREGAHLRGLKRVCKPRTSAAPSRPEERRAATFAVATRRAADKG